MERRDVDSLLDQEQVSRLFKVSTKTLEYWRCKGLGPNYVKIGKLVRYRMSDLKEYLRELIDERDRQIIEQREQQDMAREGK